MASKAGLIGLTCEVAGAGAGPRSTPLRRLFSLAAGRCGDRYLRARDTGNNMIPRIGAEGELKGITVFSRVGRLELCDGANDRGRWWNDGVRRDHEDPFF